MFFHVILTSDCNLQCKYCFGESLDDFDEDFSEEDLEVDYELPRKLNYDVRCWNASPVLTPTACLPSMVGNHFFRWINSGKSWIKSHRSII